MRSRRRVVRIVWLAVASVLVLPALAMSLRSLWPSPGADRRRGADSPGDVVLVTGYCNCGKCCGWERSWFGFGPPVYNYGSMKGRPKRVGVTATGTKAHRGTIAADPKVFPFGTVLEVPGYGLGTVEDIGGSIRGKHIDVWFPTHEEARRWGRRRLRVRTVSRPGGLK